MTYGELKFRLTQAFPGNPSLDLIEGWIGDVYARILGELPWQRQNVQAMLQTTAPYSTGTVTATAGSNAIALSGGTWTTQMSGRSFSIPGDATFYTFTYVSSASGTLDRPYEGSAAAGSAYSIWQSVYALPAGARLLEDTAFSSRVLGPMVRTSFAELNASDPGRGLQGVPTSWCSRMDDSSTPPNLQVEFWPVPDKSYGIPYTYAAVAPTLAPTNTTLPFQVWIQPSALVEGVTAKIKAHLRDYAGAQFHLVQAGDALKAMRGAEAQGMGPARMQLASFYTGYRNRRGR
jgi:hypothetical protein